MKKILSVILAAMMVVGLSACGSKSVLSSDHMTIDGICVDDDYRDEDNSSLRMVYLFYTVTASDSNMEVNSNSADLTIDGKNIYSAEHSHGACKYMKNYYYSSYIEPVYVGESKKAAATFKIPEAELEAGRKITLTDDDIPDIDQIVFYSDDIQHFNGEEEIAEVMDPEGYAEITELRQDADAARVKEVKNMINGYYWDFYVNNTATRIEFAADNIFEVSTSFGTAQQGTYTVQNGYLFCTYPRINHTVEIPYTIENGDIKMDFGDAFDVRS